MGQTPAPPPQDNSRITMGVQGGELQRAGAHRAFPVPLPAQVMETAGVEGELQLSQTQLLTDPLLTDPPSSQPPVSWALQFPNVSYGGDKPGGL